MGKYITVAPDGVRAFVALGYHTVEFKHGQIITNDAIARDYPNIFVEMFEEKPAKKSAVAKESPEAIVSPSGKDEIKKKLGRPPKKDKK